VTRSKPVNPPSARKTRSFRALGGTLSRARRGQHISARPNGAGRKRGDFRLLSETRKEAGYLAVRKGHVGKTPRTWLALTEQGRDALAAHLVALTAIVAAAEQHGRRA
jgi:hypothetical protein